MRNTWRRAAMAAVLVGLAAVGVACRGLGGSGRAKEEVRTIAAVTHVEVSGAVELDVTVADGAPTLTIRGDDNLLPHVLTTVTGDRLHIHTDVDVSPEVPLHVALVVADLRALDVSGATRIHVKGLHGESFALDASGAGSVDLQGEVSRVTVEVSGAANVEAHGLRAHTVKVELSGAASVSVYADQELTADISGVGKVEYAGHPAKIVQHVSGVGVLKARD